MPPNPTPDDLRAALADEAPEARAALERVWHLLEDAAPEPADLDASWAALSARLATPTLAPRRAPDRAAARPARRRRVAVGALAAALAAALVGAAVWLAAPAVLRAAPGETLAATLPDGSAVVLAAGAELRHPRRFGATRDVALTGEAFFEVQPGAAPFTVATHNARITVLGTAFNVRAWDGETAVALVEGRVRVAAGAATAELAPGDALTIAEGAITARGGAADREVAWRQGALSFDDRTLASVLAEVERRYAVRIAPAAGAPLGARVSAFYPQRPPLEVLLGDVGAVAGARFAPTADGYRVRAAPPSGPAPRAATTSPSATP